MHAGNFECGVLVQLNVPAMRNRAAQDRCMKVPGGLVVINERSGAGQEAQILRALDPLADQSIWDNRHSAAFWF